MWTENFPKYNMDLQYGRGTRDQILNILCTVEKAKEFQKNIYFCFIDYTKAFDFVDRNKLWKILKEMRVPDHIICLLRNLYVGQKVAIRTMDWFKTGKGVQDCILSPYLFNFFAEYIMQNAELDESQTGIKVARTSINNLRYSDDTTLMVESEERTKEPLDESERGEWKNWLESQHSKN